MSGDIPDQNEPVDSNERSENSEKVRLRKYFESAKNDLLSTFGEMGPPGWVQGFKSETQMDWRERSNDGNMPSVESEKHKGIRFIQPSLQGMVEFNDIAEDSLPGEGKGLEVYMGVASAKAFLAYSVEHNPDFNASLLGGVDARSSFHNAIYTSPFTDSIVTERSLFLMTDPTVDEVQMNRATFGLLFFTNPEKYASMRRAFEINFEREATQTMTNRTMLQVLVDTGQFDDDDVARWLAESFHEEWFASAHPFTEDEILYLYQRFESAV